MVAHFHVCTGPQENIPVSDLKFDEYEDSILCFVTLANSLFSHVRGSDYDLTIEQALAATGNGDNRGAFVGTNSLTVYWLRCEDEPHAIPAWN